MFSHPDLSHTELKPQAFTPYIAPDSKEELLLLYGEEPDYAEDAPGTVDEPDSLTAEQQSQIKSFNAQFMILIQATKNLKKTFGIPEYDITLQIFEDRITSRHYYVKQSAKFYSQIKYYLEKINIGLADNTHPENLRKTIFKDLLSELLTCGPGVFGHLKKACESLNTDNSLEYFLALFRSVIIQQLSEEHIRRHAISLNNSSHVHNVFGLYAKDINLNQLGFEKLSAMTEIHQNLAYVFAEDLINFRENFFNAYNPETIMNWLTETVHNRFAEKIKAHPHYPNISLETDDEYNELFGKLPFKDDLKTVFAITEVEEKAVNSDQDVAVKFGGYLFTLHKLSELKLTLLKVFVEEKTYNLFNAIYQNESDTQFFKVVNNKNYQDEILITVGGLVAFQHLKYVAITDANKFLIEIFPCDEVLISLPLARLFNTNPVLNAQNFMDYLTHGERNFDNVTLTNIDMRSIENCGECTFNNTRFQNVKIENKHYFKSKGELNETGFLELNSGGKDSMHLGAYVIEMAPYWGANTDWSTRKDLASTVSGDYILKGIKVLQAARFAFKLDTSRAYASRCYNAEDKNSALHYAVMQNKPEVIKRLLKCQDYYDGYFNSFYVLHNNQNKTAFKLALELRHLECISEFAKSQMIRALAPNWLMSAIKANYTDAVTELLKINNKVKYRKAFQCHPNWRPLHQAIVNNNATIFQLLLDADFGVQTQPWNGSPLQMAEELGNFSILSLYAQAHPVRPINAFFETRVCYNRDIVFEGLTKKYCAWLISAVKANDLLSVKTFIKAGTPYVHCITNTTPLHLAVQNNNLEMIKILLPIAGKNIDYTADNNLTAMDLALSHGNMAALTCFALHTPKNHLNKEHSWLQYTMLQFAKQNLLSELSYLIKLGVCINVSNNEDGNTCLHYAVINNNVAMVKLLLQYGPNPRIPNHNMQIPLQTALELNHTDCLKLIIDSCHPQFTKKQTFFSRSLAPNLIDVANQIIAETNKCSPYEAQRNTG